MFHCNSIEELEKQGKLKHLLGIKKEERPISVQIVGSNPENIKQSTLILNDYADIINFNLGCPDKDILANKAGGFFSKHPEQIEKSLKPLIENSKKPVIAKIRVGWNNDEITMEQQIKILEDLGVDAIGIHGRTVKQKYQGKANWDLIKQAKEISNIKIIGNGDIDKPGTAKARLESSKVDFLMIGRATLGNPFIFQQINYLLKNNKNQPEPCLNDRKKAFLRFTELYKENKISEFRQHAMWFTKSIKGAKKLRNDIMQLESYEKITDLIKDNF
jgi:tRNA-dihydrouridine synthase B